MLNGIHSWIQGMYGDPRQSTSPRRILLTTLAIVLLGALCCQVVWQHMQVQRTRMKVAELKRQNHELLMKVQDSRVAVTRLERLDRIQKLALTQLGMETDEDVPVLEMSKTEWVQLPREGGANP